MARRCEERRGHDWIGPELGVPARTVYRVLRRRGLPYLRECDPLTGVMIRSSNTTAVRYERDRPAELVHIAATAGWDNATWLANRPAALARWAAGGLSPP